MIGVALGQLGASLQDFLTWECDDYVNAVKFYRLQQKENWEQVRWNAYYSLISFNGSDKIKLKDITIPTDEQETAEDKKRAKWQRK
jgi:hypothetical protein